MPLKQETYLPDLSRLEAAWLDFVQKRRELPIAQWAHDGDTKFARAAVQRYEFGTALHIVAREVARLDRDEEQARDHVERQGKNAERSKEVAIRWQAAYAAKQILRALLANELPDSMRSMDLTFANALVRKVRESGL